MQRAMKWFLSLLGSMAILCGGFLVLRGSLPPASINAWLPAGTLTVARAGAASVLLQDGRLLITGGSAASGVLATTEILDPSTGFTSGPPMNLARSNHVAVLLQDGRVLVAGGTGADGRASQSAELFDPGTNSWTAAGPLMVGRSGATATLLVDGRVLIAGGTANGAALASLELFDPNSNTFTLVAGTLSSARENHTAALLPDGRVLIAGGWDGTTTQPADGSTGGPNVLASSDIFDPSTGAVAPGPALTKPRMNFTATTALDGSVVAIGGTDGVNDLASIEVLIPGAGAFALSGAQLTTARQGQLAFLLPHNGNILVVGGTSSGVAVSSAELYTPWTGATSVTGAMASARSGATGSPLFQTILGAPVGIDGALLVAGGVDASSPPNTLASAEVYGFATIKTDKPDYQPGDTAYISGSGWQPGDVVQMSLVEVPDLDNDSPVSLTATADASGNFSNVTFPVDVADLGIRFTLTAVGSASQAQTTFTDNKNLTITFAGTGTGSVALVDTTDSTNNATHTTTFTAALGNNDVGNLTATADPGSVFVGWSGTWNVGPQDNGSTSCTGTTSPCDFSMGNAAQALTATFNTAPASVGTTTTVTSSVNPSVFGQSVTFTAKVQAASGTTDPTGTVTFTIDSGSGAPITLGSCSPAVAGTACASTSTSTLTVSGSPHSVSAQYNHTGNFSDSSGSLSGGQTVNKADTSTSVTSSANPSLLDQNVTFTATVSAVSPGSGTPTGTVDFKDGATTLASGVALSGGQATFSTSTLTVGSHSITAIYSGDSNFYGTGEHTGSTATALTQQVNYGFLGLFDPYAPPSTGRAYKIKSAIPLKWQYADVNGNVVPSPNANPAVQIYYLGSCGGDLPADTLDISAAGNSGYQYDSLTNTWQFNWKTSNGMNPGCYAITITSQQTGQVNPPPPNIGTPYFPIQLK